MLVKVNIEHLERPIIVLTTTEFRFIVNHRNVGHLQRLSELKGIILWDYEGQWGLLTANHVAELVRRWDELKKATKQYPSVRSRVPTISFAEAIPVSTAVAKAIRE